MLSSAAVTIIYVAIHVTAQPQYVVYFTKNRHFFDIC